MSNKSINLPADLLLRTLLALVAEVMSCNNLLSQCTANSETVKKIKLIRNDAHDAIVEIVMQHSDLSKHVPANLEKLKFERDV